MSFNQKTKMYEINSADETMQLIKIQNRKIQELYNEIDEKDNIIRQYEQKLQNSQMYIEENKQLKYQVEKIAGDLSERELQLSQTEKNSVNFIEKEKSYLSQLTTMKNSYELSMKQLEGKISEKETEINNLHTELDDLAKNYEDMKAKYEEYEKENKELSEKVSNYALNEKSFQSKARELVNIIKNQDNELKTLQKKDLDNISSITNLANQVNEQKEQLTKSKTSYEELSEKNKENENIILSFNNQLEYEKSNNNNLVNKLNKITNDLQMLKNKLDEAESVINEKEKVIQTLHAHKNEVIQKLEYNIQNSKQHNSSMIDTINYINTLILSSMKWADTYIGSQHLKNVVPLKADINNNVLAKDANEGTKILLSMYDNVTNTIGDIFHRVRSQYEQYDNALNEIENDKQNLIIQNDNLSKSVHDLNAELNKKINEVDSKTQILSDKSDFISQMESNLLKAENKNKMFQDAICTLFNSYIDFISKNSERFSKVSEIFKNIFDNMKIEKPVQNTETKLSKVLEISNMFFDYVLCLNSEVEKKSNAIQQYLIINEECKNLQKEILEVKKGYSDQKNTLAQEKENILSTFEKNKIDEFNKIEKEYRKKLEKFESTLHEKDEEIEKLNNDNNLLYSQYLLSEKNFEEFKKNRKVYDIELQSKYEEVSKKLSETENDRAKLKNEFILLSVKMKNFENGYNTKLEENEQLKKKLNDLVKNTII